MKKLLILLFGLALACAGTSFAGNMISVTVGVDKNTIKNISVMGVGFSVNKKSMGSGGSSTTKTGPAGATYSFGFRTAVGKSISCGAAKLMQNSTVVLRYNGKTCTHKIFRK